jgi:hypothetical protein
MVLNGMVNGRSEVASYTWDNGQREAEYKKRKQEKQQKKIETHRICKKVYLIFVTVEKEFVKHHGARVHLPNTHIRRLDLAL